jgi:hypothetical protein
VLADAGKGAAASVPVNGEVSGGWLIGEEAVDGDLVTATRSEAE